MDENLLKLKIKHRLHSFRFSFKSVKSAESVVSQ